MGCALSAVVIVCVHTAHRKKDKPSHSAYEFECDVDISILADRASAVSHVERGECVERCGTQIISFS